MAPELALEILHQASELHAAREREAALHSSALLTVCSWRCNHQANVTTYFQVQWAIRKTAKGNLAVAANGCEFPKYSFTVAQHLANTFLDKRDDDVFGDDRWEFRQYCDAMESLEHLQGSNRPDQYEYQDDPKPVDKLKHGDVEVHIDRMLAPPKQRGTGKARKPVSSRLFWRCSTGDMSQLSECIDQMLKLYMLADFPKHDDTAA